MSEYRESANKRRDFRATKGDPEKTKPSPRKKKNRPHLVLYRYKPEIFSEALRAKNSTVKIDSVEYYGYWYISKESIKRNNAWRVWGRHHAEHSAIESCATLSKGRYYREYEFMVSNETLFEEETGEK